MRDKIIKLTDQWILGRTQSSFGKADFFFFLKFFRLLSIECYNTPADINFYCTAAELSKEFMIQ